MPERIEWGAEGSDLPIFSDSFFLALAETTPDCIRILNLKGELQFMNARGRALLEIEDWADVRGRYWPSLWPEVSVEAARAAVTTALRGEVARFHGFCPTARGAPKWWDTVISPVRRPDSRELIGLVATSRDVSETQGSIDAVVDQVPMMVFVKDAADGRFRLVNRAAEAVFGHTREEMLGRTDHDFFPKEQADFFRARDDEVIASGQMVVTEEPVSTRDGGLRYFRTKKVATRVSGGPQRLVCVAEDITDERQAAEALKAALSKAEAANQAKSEFVANMSHEIRTPLNGVVAVADVLRGTALDESQLEMVDLIRASGATLERMMSDILDLGRIEAGRVELQREPFHLGEAIRDVTHLQEVHARRKGVALRVEVEPAADSWRMGDALRIKQVVTNLVSNAVKFTEAGEVRVHAALEGDTFRLTVQDTGVGFDPALKDQIFHRFQQADGSITRRFGGTGLGLAITRQLVNLMGGTVDCDSVEGAGSIFMAAIPLEPAAAPGGAAQAEAERPRAMRVLLADDHPVNRKVVSMILDSAGVELVEVEDGRQAVAAFQNGAFDLVLMDMQMPNMDGMTATGLIREHERRTGARRTPVVMLTANALAEHVAASAEAGADRHLSKPVRPQDLLTAMQELTEAA